MEHRARLGQNHTEAIITRMLKGSHTQHNTKTVPFLRVVSEEDALCAMESIIGKFGGYTIYSPLVALI